MSMVNVLAALLFRLLLTFTTAITRLRARRNPRRRGDAGMSTAEYAVGTVAAVGFAIALWGVAHSGTVRDLLTGMVTHALTLPT
jgi:Protein of unknown function (DUF4244)